MNWDQYYFEVCTAVAKKSPCLSRHIGAILVRDKAIISTGYNGPARGIPHCGKDRLNKDKLLFNELELKNNPHGYTHFSVCPRRGLKFPSGEGMQWCPAQHAEENCISNAARFGVPVAGSILYLNTVIPCKNCFSTLINAGVVEIVCNELTNYDEYSKFIIENSSITIRKFEL